jgi:hypothetical protein
MKHWAGFDDSGALASAARQVVTMGLTLAGEGKLDGGRIAFDMSTESILRNESIWEASKILEVCKQRGIGN